MDTSIANNWSVLNTAQNAHLYFILCIHFQVVSYEFSVGTKQRGNIFWREVHASIWKLLHVQNINAQYKKVSSINLRLNAKQKFRSLATP